MGATSPDLVTKGYSSDRPVTPIHKEADGVFRKARTIGASGAEPAAPGGVEVVTGIELFRRVNNAEAIACVGALCRKNRRRS